MEIVQKEGFKVIGIKVRTSNVNEQAAQDISQLWNRFMSEQIGEKIPNRIDQEILSIYTNYEGDHMKPYDTILGCRVSTLEHIPQGMIGQAIEGGSYTKFIAKGDLTQGLVYTAWLNIWQADMNRVYQADYEVYGEKTQNQKDAEVAIFVGLES